MQAGAYKMISVVIPVYNERKTIKRLIDKVKAVEIPKEIIVINDGSTDGTEEILENLKDDGVKVLVHKRNYGKGRAVRTGIEASTAEIIIIQDADLEYDPGDYKALIEPILSGKSEVVYGSRWLKNGFREMPFNFFLFGRWFLTTLTNLLYGTKITDEPCGYKVFKREAVKGIPLCCEKFEFCPEITAKFSRRGYSIYEVPVNYDPRGIRDGKKVTYRDGIQALFTLLKYRFWR